MIFGIGDPREDGAQGFLRVGMEAGRIRIRVVAAGRANTLGLRPEQALTMLAKLGFGIEAAEGRGEVVLVDGVAFTFAECLALGRALGAGLKMVETGDAT